MNSKLSISLVEDREYDFNDLTRSISLQLEITEGKASEIAGELIEELRGLSQSIQRIRDIGFRLAKKNGYAWIKIESSPPLIEKEKVNFGQWVGVYRFHSNMLGKKLYVIVNPKIGINAYDRMISDVWNFAIAYGPQLINYLFNSVFGLSSYYVDAVYSYIISILTRLAVWEGLPVEIIREKRFGRVVKGKIALNRLIKYIIKNMYPYTQVRTIDAKIPRALLIRFNLLLYMHLKNLIEEYKNISNVSKAFTNLAYKNLSNIFSPELINYFSEALTINIDDPYILENIIGTGRRSFITKRVADLYLAYRAHKPLLANKILSEYEENVPILPLPSSKIYEFWVLKLLMDELINFKKLFSYDRAGYGLKFTFNNLLLYFNYVPKKWSIMIKDKDSIRPDFVLSRDGWRTILDAKYRNYRKIRIDDIERMIAYIVDVSTVDTNELVGYFVTLKNSVGKSMKWMFRSDINPNISIYLLVADPRFPYESRENIRNFIAGSLKRVKYMNATANQNYYN